MNNKSIFPTFEDLESGKNIATDWYTRVVKGTHKRSEKLVQHVFIVDIDAISLITDIQLLRNKSKKRIGFQAIVLNKKIPTVFPYTEQGWEDCISAIKQRLHTTRKAIERVVNK